MHPEQGNEPRLHFHGVLWDVSCSYNAIREAVKDLGFVWISSITDKRLRYVVKYVGKSVYMDESSAAFACRASSILSFFSFTSVSVEAPT